MPAIEIDPATTAAPIAIPKRILRQRDAVVIVSGAADRLDDDTSNLDQPLLPGIH